MQEHLPRVRKRPIWVFVAVLVCLSFFLVWTLGNFGTPGDPELTPRPADALNPAQSLGP